MILNQFLCTFVRELLIVIIIFYLFVILFGPQNFSFWAMETFMVKNVLKSAKF